MKRSGGKPTPLRRAFDRYASLERSKTAALIVAKAIRERGGVDQMISRLREESLEPEEVWRWRYGLRLIDLARDLCQDESRAIQAVEELTDVDSVIERLSLNLRTVEWRRFIDELERQWKMIADKRENGEVLAEEGRAAKAPNDAARAKRICSLYRRIRPSQPDGSQGNGAAIRDVAERYQSQTGKSITPRGVREILKRHGMMPARRKGKN